MPDGAEIVTRRGRQMVRWRVRVGACLSLVEFVLPSELPSKPITRQ